MLPVAMFTGYASGYFFGQILMRLLALVPTLGKWFVLLGFYAAGVTALVLLAAYALGHYSYPATTNYARAVEVAYLPSAYVGYAGAAIVASRRFLRAT
jgi:hypothetical protein